MGTAHLGRTSRAGLVAPCLAEYDERGRRILPITFGNSGAGTPPGEQAAGGLRFAERALFEPQFEQETVGLTDLA
ncbi:hypothetical protein GCM10011399_32450 [Subtercola lobariae]|uniref:Uncharacterized protein n=1 Tax=Subtercola lobariae TaxID=1588641 RepID=A0A917F2N0_9MICO|nr:hypothetical protein GCM10011399_32450 [Subtercola lobariae]